MYCGLNGSKYTKVQPGEKVKRNIGSNTVLELFTSLHQTVRNVTAENFFTSVPLPKSLLDKNFILFGTFRQNKPSVLAL